MKDLVDLVAWLEYGKTSGYIAAREPKEQEEEWGRQLQQLLQFSRRSLVAEERVTCEPVKASVHTGFMCCGNCGVVFYGRSMCGHCPHQPLKEVP